MRSLLADLTGEGTAGARPVPAALADVLTGRGISPVSYADWLKVEQAEAELALSLGRGARVKLPNRDAIDAICRPPAS